MTRYRDKTRSVGMQNEKMQVCNLFAREGKQCCVNLYDGKNIIQNALPDSIVRQVRKHQAILSTHFAQQWTDVSCQEKLVSPAMELAG